MPGKWHTCECSVNCVSGASLCLRDTEDRVTGCDPLALLQRRHLAETDMRSPAGSKAQIFPDNGRSLCDRDLLQPDLAPPTADDPGVASGARIPHPLTL